MTTNNNPNHISYTGRDIVAIRKALVDMIPKLTTKWTDFNESDIGMTYIEVLAAVTDLLGFYLDKQALETYITTATQSKNIKAMMTLVNQKARMTIPATCYAKIYVADQDSPVLETDVTIPRYTQLYARLNEDEVIPYVTKNIAFLPRGREFVVVEAIQGRRLQATMKVSDLVKQKIQLQGVTVAQNSVTLTINGEEWTEVDDVFMCGYSGKIFSVTEDKNNVCTITLSYNHKDYLPTDKSAPVVIEYLDTLGVEGTVLAGTITRIADVLLDSEGDQVTDVLKVTNPEASSGGADRDSLDYLKSMIPQVVRCMDKAIILEDYQVLATHCEGVLKARAFDWSVSERMVDQPYRVDVYIVPPKGDAPSQLLLDRTHQYLKERCTSGIVLNILSADYVSVDLNIEIEIVGDDNLAGEVRAGIIDELNEYFEPNNQEFGSPIRLSKLYSLLQTYHNSIESVDIVNMDNDIILDDNQFPRLGKLNVVVRPVKVVKRYY